MLALDLGQRRIGVAISDSERRVATPLVVVPRHRDRPRLHRELGELVAEWQVELVIVGLPIDLRGDIGVAAQGVLVERDELAEALSVPVEVHDERLTTRIADQSLRARGDMDGPARRKVIDMVAASVILQDWLDTHASHDAGSSEVTASDRDEGNR